MQFHAEEVFLFCRGFNIDSQNPKIHRQDADSYFGYQVRTFGGNDKADKIIVTAPLAAGSSGMGNGAVYSCDVRRSGCDLLRTPVSPGVHVRGLGLSVSTTLSASEPQLLVCSPALSYTCGDNTYVNGICYQFDGTLDNPQNRTPAFEGCPTVKLDVAFLIDGSGSIESNDFAIMKDFILKVMKQLKGKDAQFALVQFSDEVRTEFAFKDFRKSTDEEGLVRGIHQMGTLTYTPSGIKYVAEKIFQEADGARPEAKRMMIVITDGESNDESVTFAAAIQAAESKKIVRYAIGVGDLFDTEKARQELNTIASHPSKDFVFKVNSYAALKEIEESLKEKIFAIEGSGSSSKRSSFRHELAQTGFSSYFTSDAIFLGAVGSNDWSGAILEIRNRTETFVNSKEMPNAYLGYSVTEMRRRGDSLLVVGAPRYKHKGGVLILRRGSSGTAWDERQLISGEQIGSYFGAVVCSADLNGDGETDLLLIGAPLYHSSGVGGVVRVCNVTQQDTVYCKGSLQSERGDGLARFGASIAVLRDLNGDGLSDVAVGAPLEGDHRGSVYIYQGVSGGLEEGYSQRIEGRKAAPGLEYFGSSIVGDTDLDGDGLTDLVVGARGGIVILRSRPVMELHLELNFQPAQIPWPEPDCEMGRTDRTPSLTGHLCFLLTPSSRPPPGPLNVTLEFTAELDPGKQQNRLWFSASGKKAVQQLALTQRRKCIPLNISVQDCMEDFLNPVKFLLEYCIQDDAGAGPPGVQPAFRHKCVQGLSWMIPFNISCRGAHGCVTDLHLAADLPSSGVLLIKPGYVLEVTIHLQNKAELARLPVLHFEHPAVISFRRVTVVKLNRKVQVTCTDGAAVTGNVHTSCNIGHPILREKTEVSLLVTFDVADTGNLSNSFLMNLNLSSDNEAPETLQDNRLSLNVSVHHRVKLAVRSVHSPGYLSFTLGRTSTYELIHKYKLMNSARQSLPISVSFFIGYKSDIFTWNIKKVTLEQEHLANLVNCLPPVAVNGRESEANSSVTEGKQDSNQVEYQVINCTVDQLSDRASPTLVLRGQLDINGRNKDKMRKYELRTSGIMDFDRRRYYQGEEGAEGETLLRAHIVTVIEPLVEVDSLPYIVGGTAGGFVILLLVGIVFYKVGFFKRKYRDIMKDGCQDNQCNEPLNQPAPPPTET
ncbi:integrin alpha-M-like isoform X2 [Hypanus sabinus]|uniref:integrin alpha-M-like isoform X2 n=1 Tax=Hypanus sabinus TaxID=79690 RepID=UPI0028C397B6|nr:integrin alpha-M-like isoform X2 [Hypanus sabinus]